MLFRSLLFVLMAAPAAAQTPPPAAALPNPNALPAPPPLTGLPGPDPRLCGPTKYSALCVEGRWLQFAHIKLKVTATRFAGDYSLEQAANGELHATYRERIGGSERGGEIVLIGTEGFAYRSRDNFPDAGSIIDYATSNPLVMAQLATLLLDLGVLGPPSEVAAPQAIKASNATQNLRTAAPRMALLYGAPWTMTGTVRRTEGETLAFALRLHYTPVDGNGNVVKGKTDDIAIEGTVSYARQRPALPDSLDLVGWKLMRLEVPLAAVSTLGEARQAIGP